jgi:hypothetical protein
MQNGENLPGHRSQKFIPIASCPRPESARRIARIDTYRHYWRDEPNIREEYSRLRGRGTRIRRYSRRESQKCVLAKNHTRPARIPAPDSDENYFDRVNERERERERGSRYEIPRIAAEKAKGSRKNNICFHRKCESFRIGERERERERGGGAAIGSPRHTFRFTERTSSLIPPMRLADMENFSST